MHELSEHPTLAEFTAQQLGSISASKFIGWEHAESLVWCVESPHGKFILKSHGQPRKFEQERAAYRDWLPGISASYPALLATHEEEPRALLLSCLPGEVAETVALDAPNERSMYRQAGDFLRQLHGLPYEDSDIALDQAIAARLEAWSARSRECADAKDIDWVQQRVKAALPQLGKLRRVPCHRDFHARNWIWDSGRLAVFDFEHSRPDIFVMDFHKMWSQQWMHRPDLAEAFWAGYQRALAEEELDLLERLSALAALSTIAWAVEHQDRALEQHGRHTLRWLQEGCRTT